MFVVDPLQLQALVNQCIAEHHSGHSSSELFDHLRKSISRQYGFQSSTHNNHCVIFYNSLNEMLLFFRSDKRHKTTTSVSPSASVYDILVKGRCTVESIASIPASTIVKAKNKKPNTLEAGDMLARPSGTACTVHLEKDTWILELIQSASSLTYSPSVHGAPSLYRKFDTRIRGYHNLLPCLWQRIVMQYTIGKGVKG